MLRLTSLVFLMCFYMVALGITLYINDITVNYCQHFTSMSKVWRLGLPYRLFTLPNLQYSCLIFSTYIQNHTSVKILLLMSNII